MAFNPFIGWSREDLETELRAAQEDLAAGKSTSKVGAGDASTESRVDKSPEERVKVILRALNKLSPTDYPIEDITPIDRTRGGFWGADPIWPWP